MLKILLIAVAVLGFADLGLATEAGVQRNYTSYDYKESAEGAMKEVRLTIPADLRAVRGILVVTNGNGGDTRDSYKEAWYGEFLYLHDFAFMGTKAFDSHSPSVQVMQHALQQIASDSHHPELVNVPYAVTGFSAGGGFASRLVVEMPDRVLAAVIQSSRLNFTGITPTDATLKTPVCIISGEMEKLAQVIRPVLETYRPKGALYGWMTIQGGVHARTGQEVLAMPMLEAAVRLRYPEHGDAVKAPLQLKALAADSGWLADNDTWKSGLTAIAPANQFHGNIANSSWLINEDIAFIYRAYSTYDRPLTITSPTREQRKTTEPTQADGVWDQGSSITVALDDSKLPGWKKLELYDGARKVGTIIKAPAQFTVTDLTPGFHALSVLATDAQDQLRTSNPVLIIIRKPAAPHD